LEIHFPSILPVIEFREAVMDKGLHGTGSELILLLHRTGFYEMVSNEIKMENEKDNGTVSPSYIPDKFLQC